MPKRKRKEEDGSKKQVKYKGVAKKKSGRFTAEIWLDGKNQNFGTFDTAEEAARVYDRAAMEAGKPSCKLNFQDKVPMDYKPKKKELSSRNTIGYRGVIREANKFGNKFRAVIRIEGRNYSHGLYCTAEEAAFAFDLAAIEAKRPNYDPDYVLNFPDMIHTETMKKKKISKKKKKKTKMIIRVFML